jgi:hypothetical protein
MWWRGKGIFSASGAGFLRLVRDWGKAAAGGVACVAAGFWYAESETRPTTRKRALADAFVGGVTVPRLGKTMVAGFQSLEEVGGAFYQ